VQANDLLGVRSNAADSAKPPASLMAGNVSASDADDKQADTYPTAILDSGNTVNVTHPTVEIWPPEAAKRRTVSGRGVTVEDVQSTGRGKIQYHFRAPIHLLVIYERGERRSGDSFVEGLPRSALRNLARKLTFVPAGHQYNECCEPSADTRRLHFYFDPAELRIQSSLLSRPFAPHLFFDEATLWQTALKLRGLVDSSASGDPHYLDALGRLLVYELARFNLGHLGLGGFRPTIRGGLAPWQQRLVSRYIKEHFSERIPTAVVARLVGLSRFHFCRTFKQSFGTTPHRYHTNCRIEQAKVLLAGRARSVTDIGLTVGFSTSASFATAFRRATGFSPSEYRRRLPLDEGRLRQCA
jgi:AraC family transcriptional regulator